MKLNRLSFKTLITLGYGILFFFILCISIFSIIQIRGISEGTELIFKHPLTVSNSVRDINVYIISIHRSMKDVVLAENEQELKDAIQRVDENNQAALELFTIVFDRFLGDKADVEDAYKAFLDWQSIRDKVVELKSEGKNKEAAEITKNEGEREIELLFEKTKKMTDFAQNKALEFEQQTNKTEQRILFMFIIVAASLLIVSLVVAIFLSRYVIKPIKSFIHDIKKLYYKENTSKLDFENVSEQELLRSTVDELSSVYGAIEESNSELKIFNEELDRLVKERTKELEENQYNLKEKNEEYESANEELRQLNEELYVAKEKAEEGDRLKSAFLANMSHEIRTPMNGIVGFARLLQKPDLEKEKLDHYINIIVSSSNQLLSIVNDILDISKIETNQVEIYKDEFPLDKFVQNIISFFEPKAEEKGIELILRKDISANIGAIIADELKLRQVIYNLLSNALKFTKSGKVEIGYSINKHKIEFFVKDTGIGIKPELHDVIFSRFNQANEDSTVLYGGTGLGLAICKGYLQRMEGDIWVESTPGKGSVFYFTIPYLTGLILKKQELDIRSGGSINNQTILIVEDEKVNFLYLEEILKKMKLKYLHVENGKDAVDRVTSISNIGLVLMDIKLPVMDGYQATAEIKKYKPDLPVIAQTAYALAEDRNKALDAGFDDYISKPIGEEQLIGIIDKYLIRW